MPYQITVTTSTGGEAVRQYELYAPPGWEYFVQELFTQTGRDGLPLVMMLHGGGQKVSNLKLNWPFAAIPLGPTVDLLDRFFTLVPYGSTYFDLNGEPFRGWNCGYARGLDEADDAAFLTAAVQQVQDWLDGHLSDLGIPRRSIDPERKFIFGYSNGGMMAYRMATEDPGAWRGLWVQSGSYGGKLADGYTSLVENAPAGTNPVSLFAHHGELDETVVPGIKGDTTSENVSTKGWNNLSSSQGIPTADAQALTRSDRTLAGAAQAYRTFNGLAAPSFSYSATEDTVAFGTNAQRGEWRNAAGDPSPSVVVYRDPDMDHTNFTASGSNRYFDQTDVWDWFKSQAP